jgi:hypothetical protein
MDFSDTSAPEPCSRLAGPTSTTCDDELRSDSFEEISEILQERLKDMQELVCYLLRKNQELRMGIFVDRQSSLESGSSVMSREQVQQTVGPFVKANPIVYEPALRAPTAEQNEPL